MVRKMSNSKKISALKEKRDYDILNMLNSISNFEIFTPFEITQSMVSLLPEEVFKHPEYKFLDPCVKSGIFLREIVYKLDEHLPRIKYTDPESKIEYNLEDKKQRTSHILRNMIYGIAISELTAYVTRRTLYGVMEANADKIDEYLKSRIILNRNESAGDDDLNAYYDCNIFNTKDREGFESEGNIFYPVNETTLNTEDTHYPFINKTNHKIINKIKEGKMKFDIIIGNPPYQKSDGGHSASAQPIYHYFIENAIMLDPKYITMITPSRWFAGGKGLSNFRKKMLTEKRISKLIDFKDSTLCFPNVSIEGGVNYFLWDRKHKGKCEVTNQSKEYKLTKERYLDDYDIFIRDNLSIDILNKVLKNSNKYFSEFVSFTKPYGLRTNFKNYKTYKEENTSIIYGRNFKGYVKNELIPNKTNSYDSFKIFLGMAYGGGGKTPNNITGRPFIGRPQEICTETYLSIGPFQKESEAENVLSYMKTKFFRFMLSFRKNTQHITKDRFNFVPLLDTTKKWSDNELYEFFNLSKEEIEYIEKIIKPME